VTGTVVARRSPSFMQDSAPPHPAPPRVALGSAPARVTQAAPPRLAQAFLALEDDGVVRSGGSGPAAIMAALAATVILALSAPVAWAASGAAPKPSDQPSATAVSKAAVPSPDDDGGDGGG
jgi:hypothetical protein